MAEFLPLVHPGKSYTATTSADVTAGQALIISGSDTVGPGTANSIAYCGVAAFDAVSGATVTVYRPGEAWMTSSGAITAGAQVVLAASGAVSALAVVTTPTAADVTNTRGIVGVAKTTASGNRVKVLFTR